MIGGAAQSLVAEFFGPNKICGDFIAFNIRGFSCIHVPFGNTFLCLTRRVANVWYDSVTSQADHFKIPNFFKLC